MTRHEIRICGFGGQGIALAGKILGSAVSFIEKKNSVTTQSYGPESRGGASASNVVISDDIVDFPYVTEPEIFICMSKEAYTKYIDSFKEGGLFLYEENLVPVDERMNKASKIYKIPATEIADELGQTKATNMVMVGAYAGYTGLLSLESVLVAAKNIVKKKEFREINEKAIKRGIENVRNK